MGTPTQREYTLAQLSNSAYRDESEIRREGGLPSGWAIFKSQDTNSSTGFVAHAYFNESTKEIVIAYRGSEINRSMIDWKQADLALAKDGDPDRLLKGTSLEKYVPNAKELLQKAPNWDAQFGQGLDFADEIIKKYGHEYKISVTGHSLGGSIAQVASKMHNLPGITFDPGGAKNIVESQEFKNWAKAHGKPENGLGSNNSPTNYVVNNSVVSNYSGPQVGITMPVSGIAHEDWKSKVSDAWSRHSMPRILEEFKDAYEHKRALNIIGMTLDTNQTIQLAAAQNNDNKAVSSVNDLSAKNQTLVADSEKHVHNLYKEYGLTVDKGTQNTVMCVAVAAAEQGMCRIDRSAVKDGNINVAQMDGAVATMASVNGNIAANTPVEQSLSKLASIEQSQAQSINNPSQTIEQPKQGRSMG